MKKDRICDHNENLACHCKKNNFQFVTINKKRLIPKFLLKGNIKGNKWKFWKWN